MKNFKQDLGKQKQAGVNCFRVAQSSNATTFFASRKNNHQSNFDPV